MSAATSPIGAISASVINPLENAGDFDAIYIGGTRSPGVIAVNGIEGFRRKTKWDKKLGKGSKGAVSTLTQEPPAEGRITFLLWLPHHWDDWATFLPLLQYTPDKGAEQAVSVYHPELYALGISALVTEEIGLITHLGRGRYERIVQFHEWQQPPAVSIVETPSAARVYTDPNPPGDTPDPDIVEAKRQASELLGQAGIP